ncbi:MAG: VOC family protein, partial [Bacteroidales bacterium]|nr:VOC family protein [Bacteroidales bacterium]
MKINRIDHLVLTVTDVEDTVNFYTQVLGMEVEYFAQNRVALKFGIQKIYLHRIENKFESKAKFPTCGSADLCFVVEENINDVKKELEDKNVNIIEGVVTRTGAFGSINSIYLYDPDNNLIEISNYDEEQQKMPELITKHPNADIPISGIDSYLIQAGDQQFVFMEFFDDAEIPVHSHNAQWGIVIEGEIELTIKNTTRTLRKGDTYY